MPNTMKSFIAKIEKLDSSVWSVALIIMPEQAAEFLGPKNRRVLCTLNDEVQIHAGLMPKGNGIWFININKELRKKLNIDVGSEVKVLLEKDNSKYGMLMPMEMKEILATDVEAEEVFHKLTPGKQRTLLHLIAKPKSSDIRISKALRITEYLKMTEGKIDFKELNQWLKA